MASLGERPHPPAYPVVVRLRDRDPATWPDHNLARNPQDLEAVPDDE